MSVAFLGLKSRPAAKFRRVIARLLLAVQALAVASALSHNQRRVSGDLAGARRDNVHTQRTLYENKKRIADRRSFVGGGGAGACAPFLFRRIRRDEESLTDGDGDQVRVGEPAHLVLFRCERSQRIRRGMAV